MTNKTPLQELIEYLEEIKKGAILNSFYNGISAGINKAEELLEKEKNIIVDAYEEGRKDECATFMVNGYSPQTAEEYFNQTFKP